MAVSDEPSDAPPFPRRHSRAAIPAPPFPRRHSRPAIPAPPFPTLSLFPTHSLTLAQVLPSVPLHHRARRRYGSSRWRLMCVGQGGEVGHTVSDSPSDARSPIYHRHFANCAL